MIEKVLNCVKIFAGSFVAFHFSLEVTRELLSIKDAVCTLVWNLKPKGAIWSLLKSVVSGTKIADLQAHIAALGGAI